MANYYCTCRSNYFKVGRPKEFMEWIATVPDVVFKTKDPDSQDLIGMVYGDNPDGGGWPCWRYDENDDEQEFDFFADLAEFLAPGEVVVFEEVGAEKLRYLHGSAVAVRWDGEVISLTLGDIYRQIKEEWALEPTQATY